MLPLPQNHVSFGSKRFRPRIDRANSPASRLCILLQTAAVCGWAISISLEVVPHRLL